MNRALPWLLGGLALVAGCGDADTSSTSDVTAQDDAASDDGSPMGDDATSDDAELDAGDGTDSEMNPGPAATPPAEPDADPSPSDPNPQPGGSTDEMAGETPTADGGETPIAEAPSPDVTAPAPAPSNSSVTPVDETPGPAGTSGDPAPDTTSDELSVSQGCAGVYNPDQMLELHLELPGGDWNTVLADTTYAAVVSAQFRCNDDAPITVGVRRKRSGGQNKVGLKIDMNAFVDGQTWYGLKKLSLENGVSEGDTTDGAEVRAYLSEYLSWRIMVLSGAISSRAALVNLHVNGDVVGVYVNLEQVDKRFLDAWLGDDSGWLYKKSGGVGDGLKTHETDGLENPHDDYFCFWASGNGCPVPAASTLAEELPLHLDIPQFLRFGAVNAFIANPDGPLFKDNNYYFYDWSGGRSYIPWDLDTAMKNNTSVFTGGGGGGGNGTTFADVLFTNWRDEYEATLVDLLQNKTPLDTILAEIDRVERVSGSAFAADPYVSGTAADAASALSEYWLERFGAVETELGL